MSRDLVCQAFLETLWKSDEAIWIRSLSILSPRLQCSLMLVGMGCLLGLITQSLVLVGEAQVLVLNEALGVAMDICRLWGHRLGRDLTQLDLRSLAEAVLGSREEVSGFKIPTMTSLCPLGW